MKKTPVLLLCLCTLLAFPAEAKKKNAEKQYPLAMTPYEKSLVMDTDFAIALVEIKDIPNEKWTNGNPPRPVLKILKLLKGGDHPWNMNAIWEPLPYDPKWAGDQAELIMKKWREIPMEAPKKGSEWYVTGKLENKTFHVAPIARYPTSKDAYETLSDMAIESIKEKPMKDGLSIIKMAAYGVLITSWSTDMQKSNLAELAKRADLVARANLVNMVSKDRLVEFNVINFIKKPTILSSSANTVKLQGLPDKLYEVLYACNNTPEEGLKEFLILMNVRQTEGENPTTYFVPVDAAYAIQLSTDAKLKLLGVAQ